MANRQLFRQPAIDAQRNRALGVPLPRGGPRRTDGTPVILQAEAAECGLVCLAMVAGRYGHVVDLAALRERHAVSLMGTTLADLVRIASDLKLASRPVRVELEHLAALELPCVLHWDFNHFVVLTRVHPDGLTIHDPALGRRRIGMRDASAHFTGVALELTPTREFAPKKERNPLRFSRLLQPAGDYRATIVRVVLLVLLLQVFTSVAPLYLKWVVDRVLVTGDRDLLFRLSTGFMLLVLVQTGVTALRAWTITIAGTRLNLEMLSNVFRHLIRLPMAWFIKRRLSDVVSRFESLDMIQHTLTTNFFEAMIDGLMVVITFTMMIVFSVKLALVGVASACVYGVLRWRLYWPARIATEEQLAKSATQQGHFLESIRGMQAIKLAAREEHRSATWLNLVADELNARIRTQRFEILYQALNGLIFGVENIVTVWLGALLIMADSSLFTPGMLFAFLAYKVQFVQRVGDVVEKGLELRMLSLHVERVSDIVSTPVEMSGAPEAVPAGNGIELKQVEFRYAESLPLIIKGLSLRIEDGETVAIVGPSGCGKTTLIKLMLGLLEPCAGVIEVGGVPIPRIGMPTFRKSVASVMQDDHLFAGSIAENICFFDMQQDLARIEECARLAAVHADISAMPMQFDTLVGDMGTVLSGGQKQRILLARALYSRPKILFLDEATSHLDVEFERLVNEAVRALKLTRVIVAHRPETIRMADRVVAMRDGRLVESPAHSSAASASPRTSLSGGQLAGMD